MRSRGGHRRPLQRVECAEQRRLEFDSAGDGSRDSLEPARRGHRLAGDRCRGGACAGFMAADRQLLSSRLSSPGIDKGKGAGSGRRRRSCNRSRPPPSASHDACLHSASTSAASGRGAACGPSAARRLSGREPHGELLPHAATSASRPSPSLSSCFSMLGTSRPRSWPLRWRGGHPHHLGLDLDRGQHGDRQAVRDLLGGTSTRTVLVDLRKPEGAAAERLVERGLCEWGAPFEDGDQLAEHHRRGPPCVRGARQGAGRRVPPRLLRPSDGRARGVPPGAVAALG